MAKYKCIAFLNREINDDYRSYHHNYNCGYANGYVAIPPEHPLYNCGYDDFYVDVHGGLTFAEFAPHVKNCFNPNFLELCELNDIPDDYKVFGFDTMHYMDNINNWSREMCIDEVEKLKEFFENYESEE